MSQLLFNKPTHFTPRGLISRRVIIISSIIETIILLSIILFFVFKSELGQLLEQMYGPPQVALLETYQAKPDGPVFDHWAFDALLKKYVTPDGLVNYKALAGESSTLDEYIESLATAPFDELGRNEKLALLINAYNAFTLRLILDYDPIDSIKAIPAGERWEAVRWTIADKKYSLSEIEHQQIRPKFNEPRIHFALVCAAVSCPKLRSEAYVGNRLEKQLDDQAKYAFSHSKWFAFDPLTHTARLTMLLNPAWYGSDFDQSKAGSALKFAAQYAPRLKQALDEGADITIEWIDYDWSLNSR